MCKIHNYFEIKIDSKWKYWRDKNDYSIGRDYTLYSLLANVRNYLNIEPISEPKSFPIDASVYVKKIYDCWKNDAYDASYLTIDEIYNYKEYKNNNFWFRLYFDWFYTSILSHIVEHVNKRFAGIDTKNIRMVFWFSD